MNMDKINTAVNEHMREFKSSLQNKITSYSENELKSSVRNELLTFIYDHNELKIDKTIFAKKKRAQNVVDIFDRCIAKRATNEQCTRRKKSGCDLCGTHMKGTPHGVTDNLNTVKPTTKLIETWMQSIMGIDCYIDNNNNVYMMEDILKNVTNPRIFAKYVKNGEEYSFVN
jgi:hypothetical protein